MIGQILFLPADYLFERKNFSITMNQGEFTMKRKKLYSAKLLIVACTIIAAITITSALSDSKTVLTEDDLAKVFGGTSCTRCLNDGNGCAEEDWNMPMG